MSRFVALLCVAFVVGCSVAPPSPSPFGSTGPSPGSSAGTSLIPSPTGTPTASLPPVPPSATLPIRGSARHIGEQVLMAPGPGGTLYTLLPGAGGTVLARLGGSGQPLPGWPIGVPGMTACWQLLPVDDGSVRVVCAADNPIGEQFPSRAFAFANDGRALPGWPIDLPSVCCADGRVIGNTLTLYARDYPGETVDGWIVSIAADGTVRNGVRVTYPHCCDDRWAIGPGGIAYRVIFYHDETGANTTSELAMAVGPEGLLGGFPVTIKGVASTPVFDAAGRLHVTVATASLESPYRGPARTLVFDTDGEAVAGGSGDLGFVAMDLCEGLESSCAGPPPPLVGADGTTFVIGAGFNGTTAARVSPSGQVVAGWPYRSDARHESKFACIPGVDGGDGACEGGYNVAAPAIGPDNALYLIHAGATSSVGGIIIAVGSDGKVRNGWPVELQRGGAEFWSVVVGSDGTAYVLAIEPEPSGKSSASILAFAPDSTVRYTTTIIEP